MNNDKTALITGASKGLGKALALTCAARGYNLILVSLPKTGTTQLAQSIEEDYKVRTKVFEFDLTVEENIYELVNYVEKTSALNLLINNAGCGGTGSFETSSLEYIDLVLKLNIRVTTMLTRLLIPSLRMASGRAYVMNISSMAAFSPIGFKHVYPASKAFLYAFTMGLREEYRDSGISFSTIHPGPMLTNSDTSRRIIQQGAVAKFCLVNTIDIAKTALKRTLRGKAVIVPGWGNKISYWTMKILPSGFIKKLLTRVVRREIALYSDHSVVTPHPISA